MSSHIKHKLWSQLRDPVSILPSKPCRRRPLQPPFHKTTHSHTSRRTFSQGRPRSQNQTPQRRSVVKSFASCALLFIDAGPSGTTAPSAITSCVSTAEKSLYSTTILHNRPITSLAQQAWRREMHSSSRRRERGTARRNKSSTSSSQISRNSPQDGNTAPVSPTAKNGEFLQQDPSSASSKHGHLPHMPKIPHRPTKEELLAAATGFWSRLKVRFKWFSIRSVRPWNIDDWSAFVSWFVLGNIVWVLVGTTTFFSLVILSINTVVAQGMSNRSGVGRKEVTNL